MGKLTGIKAKPTGAGAKPAGAGAKPAGAGAKPAGAGAKPTGGRAKPTGAGAKPTGAGAKPTGAGAKPTGRLLDSLHTAVLVFDERLRLTDINAAGEDLFLISRRKRQGHAAAEILPAAPGLVENMRRVLATGQPCMEWDADLFVPGAKARRVDYTISPLLEAATCKGVVLELSSIDSQARIIQESNLSSLHEAARRSLGGMAHEIKNPLGGLRGAAQLLERELDDPALVEYTRIIINEADRLHNLVDRMPAPALPHHARRAGIYPALERVCAIVEAEAEFNLAIRRDYDPSLPQLRVDREQLIQALLNIARNAAQAIDAAGEIVVRTRVKRHCTIRRRRHRLAVRIDVIDNGPGVPGELAEHIFYPMVTGRAGGTGLGLSIAQSLIQAHGGALLYERIEEWSYFRILLPAAD